MATHVVVGKSDNGANTVIKEMARDGVEWSWTVPRVAHHNDDVLFYLLNPEGCFVAIGRLTSDATEGRSAQNHGRYLANVAHVRMLPRSVPRLEVVAGVPGWGWPKQPHTVTTVPDEHVDVLLNLLT